MLFYFLYVNFVGIFKSAADSVRFFCQEFFKRLVFTWLIYSHSSVEYSGIYCCITMVLQSGIISLSE